MSSSLPSFWKHFGLKDTMPRRAVLHALEIARKPLSIQQVHDRLEAGASSIGIVTVYRVMRAFVKAGLVHEHPIEGTFSVCSMPDAEGHHVLVHCHSCGSVREAQDAELCRREDKIAKRLGFHSLRHVSELTGICSRCF
ncbi:hypothetical protein A3D88_04505 [Candidatus Peribacteria bacterium RIFCSPHIGHO2_02_FULL_52_16]|nr:MAG: hypothetical protein A2706_03135 [Candidatus Peribacteria bacterium RIFCSPHIGHO2_01_FULL_51_35]OGJ60867.1 MAG: hypothetical protein A3D88_04505 [Candidatus Peribacteria bacterium RIFCSPHIGHO2_02_FULL_52_16]